MNGNELITEEGDDGEEGLNLGFLDVMDDEEVLAFSGMIAPVWDKLTSVVPPGEIGGFAAFGALVELVRELATEIDQNERDDEMANEAA